MEIRIVIVVLAVCASICFNTGISGTEFKEDLLVKVVSPVSFMEVRILRVLQSPTLYLLRAHPTTLAPGPSRSSECSLMLLHSSTAPLFLHRSSTAVNAQAHENSIPQIPADVYHTALPLAFEVNLPPHLFAPSTNNTNCTEEMDCRFSEAVASIFGHMEDELDDFGTLSRQERVWGFVAAGVGGFLIRPALAKVFPS